MKHLKHAAIGIAFAGIFALPMNASAAIVCNAEGDCWRTVERYSYPPDVRLNIYEDDWVLDTKKYRWREVGKGRGYWRGGVWITF